MQYCTKPYNYKYRRWYYMIYGIGDVIYIQFRLQQQNIACITAAASRSTTLYTDQYIGQEEVYKTKFEYMRMDSTIYLLGMVV